MRALMGALLLLAAAPAFAAPAPLPAPAIDNERVTVWDLWLDQGKPGPATPSDRDVAILIVQGGTIRAVAADGKAATAERTFGEAVWLPRGSSVVQTLTSPGRAHELVVALKDVKVPPVPNRAGLPPAFPRPGSVKTFENDRVVVWNYTWRPGQPTPMHFHDKDVVLAYRYDGALKSVAPDGTVTVNSYKAGEIRFNKADRAHFEELAGERQSAVMMELK